MRTGFGLVVGVLTALAASGCKDCAWCRGDRPQSEGTLPMRSNSVPATQTVGPALSPGATGPGAFPQSTMPAGQGLPPAGSGLTGAYSGPRN